MLLTFDNTPLPLFFFFLSVNATDFPWIAFPIHCSTPLRKSRRSSWRTNPTRWTRGRWPRSRESRWGGGKVSILSCIYTWRGCCRKRKEKERNKDKMMPYHQFGKAFASMSSKNLYSQAVFSHVWPHYAASYHQWKMFLTFGEEWMKRSSPCGVSDYFLAASGR